MQLGDAHAVGGSSGSSHPPTSLPCELLRRSRRIVHNIAFFLSSTWTHLYRGGVRGCVASLRQRKRYCAPLQWLSITGPSRRFSASMDYIEQFRQGPETQSEWNLLLWRVTFPMIALVIFTLLAVLGKFGHGIYSFLVCPVWYFSQCVLVAHPFLLVFKYQEADDAIRKRIWHALAVISVGISGAEWFLSSPPDGTPSSSLLGSSSAFAVSIKARFLRHSWIVANTVFGVVVLVAIPRYFYLQKRSVARDSYDALSGHATALFMPLSPTLVPRSTPQHSPLSPRLEETHPQVQRRANATTTTPPSSSSGGSCAYSSVVVTSTPAATVASLVATQRQRTRTILILTACGAALVWIAMVSSYSSIKPVDVISKYWFTLYMCSPVVCALLIYVLRGQPLSTASSSSSSAASANVSMSFDFVAIYSVLLVHLPIFLGHLCFRLFTIIELADPAHPAHAEARGIEYATNEGSGSDVTFSASTSWMKLGISIVYLLVMQTYFHVMTQVVNAMAEPFAHPSLLYLGQLYYYLFWYVLVGSDTPIDALYWGMLLVNNVHIAFLNTGIYADVKQTSTTCLSAPMLTANVNLFRGSSMALCFRATTVSVLARTAAVCRSDDKATRRHRHSKDEVDEDDPEEALSGNARPTAFSLNGSEPDDSTSNEATTPVKRRHQVSSGADNGNTEASTTEEDSAQKTVRRNPGKTASVFSALFGFDGGSVRASTAGVTSATGASSTATIYFSQCTCGSRSDQGACTCSRQPSAPHSSTGNDSNNRSTTVPAVVKQSTTNEQLRPLYFLMKLAEQDNMADTTALILVPSLLTLLAVLDKPSHGLAIIIEQMHLWIRCIFMFAGRMGGAYLAREIFTYKLRARLRSHQSRRHVEDAAVVGQIEGVSTRMWIQRLMLQDFHRHFWYLTIVTIVVTFACFERMEVPARFALLT